MTNYILITGASSGIGFETAKILASKGHDLILTARSESILKDIKLRFELDYKVKIKIYTYDLSNAENAIHLYNGINEQELKVDALINNAGFGVYGEFVNSSLEDDLLMIQLNCSSLVVLSKLFARDFLENKSGVIINIASLLSYLPFPYYSVYSGTKSFVLAFSETLRAELAGSGVQVKVLCPGPTNTPFQTEAMWKTKAYKANKPMPADKVAQDVVELLFNQKGRKISGFMNWFLSNLPRVTPDSIMMKIKKNLASQV